MTVCCVLASGADNEKGRRFCSVEVTRGEWLQPDKADNGAYKCRCLATCPLLANLSRHPSFAIPPVSRLRRYLPPVLMRTLRSTTTGTAHSNQARQGDPHLSSNPRLSSDVSLSFDTCLSSERGRASPTQRSVVRLTCGALLLILGAITELLCELLP